MNHVEYAFGDDIGGGSATAVMELSYDVIQAPAFEISDHEEMHLRSEWVEMHADRRDRIGEVLVGASIIMVFPLMVQGSLWMRVMPKVGPDSGFLKLMILTPISYVTSIVLLVAILEPIVAWMKAQNERAGITYDNT